MTNCQFVLLTSTCKTLKRPDVPCLNEEHSIMFVTHLIQFVMDRFRSHALSFSRQTYTVSFHHDLLSVAVWCRQASILNVGQYDCLVRSQTLLHDNQWLLWLPNTMHPPYMMFIFPLEPWLRSSSDPSCHARGSSSRYPFEWKGDLKANNRMYDRYHKHYTHTCLCVCICVCIYIYIYLMIMIIIVIIVTLLLLLL